MSDIDKTRQDSMPEIGAVIDSRYQLIESIGTGATGAVFKAKHVGIGRMVAVKLARPDVGNIPEVAARFEREALAIGLISHPNCVTVLDAGQLSDGTRFLAMELLQGRPLADVLMEAGQLTVTRALHIARHVLRGLAHAHDAGIVHRDIKPENIFLVELKQDPDFAKILDFGLAKLLSQTPKQDSAKPLTRAGMTFGTPRYMSPEQVCGKPVDGRADVYSLAVVLYELIAGRPPFEGEDPMEILPMHLSVTPPPLSEVAEDVEVSSDIEELIMRGLEKKAENRLSAAEFLAAIDEICSTDWVEEHTPMPSFFPTESQLELDAREYAKMREGGSAADHGPIRKILGDGVGGGPVDRTAATQPLEVLEGDDGADAEKVPALVAAQSAGRARLHLTYGAALLVVVLLAGGWLFFSDPKEVDMIKEAEALTNDGKPKAAIALLQAKPERLEGNTRGLLVLGHAYVAAKNYPAASETYKQGILLDPELAGDKDLRANLRTALESGRVPTRNSALEVLQTIAQATGDASAKQDIIQVASADPRRPTRHTAMGIAKEIGLLDQVDRLQSYSLDLTEPDACLVRKKAVALLRDLGDKRAIPVLETARDRRRNKKKVNVCLQKAADEAIAHLQAL